MLREAEHRSTAPIPYWNIPGAKRLVPRQRRCEEALKVVNTTLDGLIAKCKKLVEEEVGVGGGGERERVAWHTAWHLHLHVVARRLSSFLLFSYLMINPSV